jgi:D-tagatose-1,6-bisphosphate aldolase subunit GatZ/KbaZ
MTGDSVGIYSACTAHPLALEAVIEAAHKSDTYALIEATANQVDQFGGYTGMTPAQFVAFVRGIARKAGLPQERLILGGDHLGPLVWRERPEAEAMGLAEDLVRAYVRAGFTKIHLDTSMRLADDDPDRRLSDGTIARRAARLAAVAEHTYAQMFDEAIDAGLPRPLAPVYIIGSEVPIPGGAEHDEEEVAVTAPEDFIATYEAFENAFAERGLNDAFERIVGVVVQPGVEFSDSTVTAYDRAKASALIAALEPYEPLVFEGHSTDYQSSEHLRQMVEDGIAILKVGPALTFALREALFELSEKEEAIGGADPGLLDKVSHFAEVLKAEMHDDPTEWVKHYHGTAEEIEEKLVGSYSDRCRYYLPHPKVEAAMRTLLGNTDPDATFVKDHIKARIDDYLYATDTAI